MERILSLRLRSSFLPKNRVIRLYQKGDIEAIEQEGDEFLLFEFD